MKYMYRLSFTNKKIQEIQVRKEGVFQGSPRIEYRYTNPLDYKNHHLKKNPDGWITELTDGQTLFFETIEEAKNTYTKKLDRDIFSLKNDLLQIELLREEMLNCEQYF